MGMNQGWVACIALVVLSACGGGDGDEPRQGSAPQQTRPALPTVSEDTYPTGARLDYRSRNYFPAAPGDSWTYEHEQGGFTTGVTLSRAVSSAGGADVLITETSRGEASSSRYRRTSEGLVAVRPLEGAPAAMTQFVGDLLEYPEPFYAVGGTRRIVRQGNAGEDLDGDGVLESFRLEIGQVLVEFGPLNLPNGRQLQNVAHLRTMTTLALQPSGMRYETYAETSTEDTWWAPGIGLVRAERSVVDLQGTVVEPAYAFVLTGGTVGGLVLFGADGAVMNVPLVHNALVFDRTRNRYYASVPGSVPLNGNRIATIDPVTGAVSYSALTVGSQPWALALNADASALYVGLNGTGEVVKLRLPDLVEQWRVRLPTLAFYGQLSTEKIAVSPVDADLVAVSTVRPGVSPRHGGVALIRGGVLLPRMTQEHTGSNLITFGPNGDNVYGFNNETTEFGLRRIAVLADGLQEMQVVTASGNFGSRTLDWSGQMLVLDRAVYRAPDLRLFGQAEVDGGGCRPHNVANRLICAYTATYLNGDAALAVVDASSFVILATPYYYRGYGSGALSEIVPGPLGQVALRLNATYYNSSADTVLLFTSQTLQ
ncbi:MAG: hypothetical protein H7Y33_01960 [Cytophagales bacterium]|nr:hypothetical protein [Rhizobacter sp.]